MDIRRRAQIGGIKKASSGGGSTVGSYTVNLNSQWEKTTAVTNPDSTLYDGVYRSSSNYNVDSGVSIMYITIKDCSSFKMYIRSYAESNYDYVMVSQLDQTINGSTSYSNTTLVKEHTRGNQQSGTALSSYTLVEFTGIPSGEHTITVVYRKDGSVNNGDDRGYVLIDKTQSGSGDSGSGEDVIPEPIINIDNYLTIEALENGLTAKLSTNSCEYCVDGDGNWKSLAAGTATQSINSGHILSFRGNLIPNNSNGIGTFTINKKCNLKGNCMSMLFGDNAADNYSLEGKDYAFNSLFYVYGLMNIVNVSENFLPATTLSRGCYIHMFYGCTSLKTAPALPATTLSSGCYQWMFSGCTSLTTAPALPATTLVDNCYYYMFTDCTSLKTAPALPATTLADGCYQYMFNGCASLTTAPALPATTLANNCCNYMFKNCTSLKTAPVLPATNLTRGCYRGMFYNCTSLTTAPELPATILLADYCYYSMFQNCTSLTTAPELPAITLKNYCYKYMFNGCTNLNYIEMHAANISATECLYDWVYSIANTGTFVKHPDMTTLPTGSSGIPEGWTVVDDVKEPIDTNNYLTIEALEDGLTASLSKNYCEYCVDGNGNWKSLDAGTVTESINTGQTLSFRGELTPGRQWDYGIGTFTISKKCNLKGNCMSMLFVNNAADIFSLSGKNCAFYELFYDCANIVNVSSNFLPATTLAESCYYNMFNGCTSLVTTPELPATTLSDSCYQGMFSSCTSLTTAPELPATTLAESCYFGMFSSCTSLTTAPELPVTTLAESCYEYMFKECTSLKTAPELPATTLVEDCYYGMFEICSKLNYIKMLATDISANNCLRYWVWRIPSSGTFVKHPDMTSLQIATQDNGYSGIPKGWVVVNDGEESGGSSLTFPVTLVEGDNGQLGIDLFNYLIDKYDEQVSFNEHSITEQITINSTTGNYYNGDVVNIITQLNSLQETPTLISLATPTVLNQGVNWFSRDYFILYNNGYLEYYND